MHPSEHEGAGSASHAARVSFVCTANRARSPFAAALLRRHVEGADVVVDSFGVLDRPSAPALLSAVRAARDFAIDLRGHRSQPLADGALCESDLVIGFEPFHVAASVVAGGADRSRAFLLTELAETLEEGAPGAPFEAILAGADARRRTAQGFPRSLADPVGGSDRLFRELYHEIDRLVAIIAVQLFCAARSRAS